MKVWTIPHGESEDNKEKKLENLINKLPKSSKFLSPQQAAAYYGILPYGTDFGKAWNPHSKLRGILQE